MKLILSIVTFGLLLGCQLQSETTNMKITSQESNHSSQGEASQSPKTNQAIPSPGKRSAPIKMSYKLLGTPTPGKALGIAVNLSAEDQKTVNAKISHSKKLQATNNIQKLSFKPKEKTQKDDQIITVTPLEEGIHYVNIQAEVEINGRIQSKAFAIPIEVGNVNWEEHLKPDGEIKNDATGGKVISMPAE